MCIRIALLLFALVLSTVSAAAQKPNRFEDAIARSQDAGRIITLLAVSSESGLPRELIDRAEAVGVFPKVTQETLYFSKLTHGYGVISSRLADGWSLPAYYQFSGGGYGNPFKNDDAHGVILLFMTKEAVSWFEKGGVPLKNEKKAIAGPVGAIPDELRSEIDGAQIIAYAYYNGNLSGKAFGKSFWKNFLLDPDNKINNPLYGMKGREVLAGKLIAENANRPAEIPAFKLALDKYYPPVTSAERSTAND